jgi:hypothetical protein
VESRGGLKRLQPSGLERKGVRRRPVTLSYIVKFKSCLPDSEGLGTTRETVTFRGLRCLTVRRMCMECEPPNGEDAFGKRSAVGMWPESFEPPASFTTGALLLLAPSRGPGVTRDAPLRREE